MCEKFLKELRWVFIVLLMYAGCGGSPRDFSRPGRIIDLNVLETGPDYVVLQWTAPGDDGYGGGRANRYEIRYATAPIDKVTWDSAMPIANVPSPSDPGVLETFTVRNLEIKSTYYFGIRTYDEAGNRSELSNITSTVTTDVPGGSGRWAEAVNPSPPSTGAFVMGAVDSSRSRILFLMYPYTYLYVYSISTPVWQQVGSSSPPVLGGGTLEYLEDSYFYLFGGVTGSGYVNSEHYFDPATMDWAPYISQGILPAARAGACYAVDPATGIMYLFGGEFGSSGGTKYYNDVYSFDPSTGTWSLLEPSTQTQPQARGGAACVFVPPQNVFLIIGGADNYTVYDDIWALKLTGTSPEWKRLTPDNAGPGEFFNARAFYDSSASRVILIGGVDGDRVPLRNPWMITITDSLRIRWTKLKPDGTPPVLRGQYDCIIPEPSARRVFYFSSNGNKLYILNF